MSMLLKIFLSFLVIGLGAYGGGLVTIPLIQHEIVNQQHWLTLSEMVQMLALSQMTPGPIAINAATFVGFRLSGLVGALLATCAVVVPSLIILLVLTPFLDRFQDNPRVRHIRENIQLGVLSLILFAAWSYGAATLTGWIDLLMAVVVFGVFVLFEGKIHPMVVILGCGVIGIVVF